MKKILLLLLWFIGLRAFAQSPVLTLPAGHTAHIASSIVSPDNKYLISSSDDNTTKIWEMASGKLLYNFPDKTAAGGLYMFDQFIFKNNGTELIALGKDVLMIFDFDRFKITKQVALKGFVSAALAANDRTLYITTRPEMYKATILSMDLQDFSVKKLYTQSSADNYNFAIYRISLNKQENKLLCFNARQESVLIDTAGKELEKFNTDVNMLCFLPNGEMMGIKNLDSNNPHNFTIRVINADTKQVNWETNITFQGFYTYYYNFQTIQFDKKSGQCLLASDDDFAVFDYVNHTAPNLYPVPVGRAHSMCFTPKSGVFVIGTQAFAEGGVKLYTFNKNNNLASVNFGDALMFAGSLKTSALASTILLGGFYKTFKQLSITPNGFRVHNLLHNKPGPFLTTPDLIGISPDGKTGVKASINSVSLYNTEAPGEKYDEIDTPQTSAPQEVVFSDDGTLLATIGGAEVRVIDVKSKKVLMKIPTGDDYLFQGKTGTGAISPDNKTLIAFSIRKGKLSGYMACFNITTGAKLWERSGADYSFKFSSDNAVVFCIDRDRKMALWLNAHNGTLISEKSLGKPIDNAVITSDLKYALLNVGSTIEIWNLATFTKTGELTGHLNKVNYSALISNEKYLVSYSADNTIRIWDWKNQKELLKLILFDDNEEWAAFTPDGRFDATPDMLKKMYYTRGKEIIPLEELYEQFLTPLLINRVLNGEKFKPLPVDINNIKRAPRVKISYTPGQRNLVVSNDIPTFKNTTGTAEITVNASAEDDKIDEIRLFQNGKIVNRATRGLFVTDNTTGTDTKKYTINLLPGMNSIRAVALNSQRTESKPDEIAIIYQSDPAQGNLPAPANVGTQDALIATIDKNATLHLIVVGINTYKNPKMSLNYALADATAFKDEAERDAHTMITDVNTYFVTDDKADKKGIVAAFSEVEKNAKPQDVFVFYYAGHGVISDKNQEFYLVPNDVADLKNVDEALAQNGISSKMLQQYAINITAQKQVFILDACQSAGAFSKLMANDGDRQKSMAVVARSTGTHWIAASGSQQFANEFSQLGHGAFTYVLLKAMKGDAASNKMVTINGLKNYLQVQVPDLMKKYNGTPQYPSSYGLGNDFPVEVMK